MSSAAASHAKLSHHRNRRTSCRSVHGCTAKPHRRAVSMNALPGGCASAVLLFAFDGSQGRPRRPLQLRPGMPQPPLSNGGPQLPSGWMLSRTPWHTQELRGQLGRRHTIIVQKQHDICIPNRLKHSLAQNRQGWCQNATFFLRRWFTILL